MAKIDITDATFKTEVLDEKTMPVLVDFWATWCYPCKAQAPIIEEIATEMSGKIKIAEMDVDANPLTPQSFSIMSIPTLVIFKDGKPVWQGVGLHQKIALVTELKKYIG